MKLVEEYAGVGDLSGRGEVLRQVRYRIARYQAFSRGTAYRSRDCIGSKARSIFRQNEDVTDLVGAPLVLRLEDGRTLAVTLADTTGRVLSEGHGPSRCLCC